MTGIVGSGANIDFDRPGRAYPGIVEDLRRYDAQLALYYDTAVARYGICRFAQGTAHFIALWQDDDGNPRPIDQRLVREVISWDLRPSRLDAPRDANEEADRREAREAANVAKVEQDFDGDISHLTRSNRRYLGRAVRRYLNI